jgi:hypothetical protein
MKVKLLTSIASNDYSFNYGEVTEKLPLKDAKSLIAKGLAQEVKPAPKTASKKAK